MGKYKICVVGAGRWGANHIKTLHNLNCLVGVVDNNKSTLKRVTHNYPECQTFSNLKDSLKRNFDAYIVSTPPNTHYNIAKIIIDNKKHVLVEKPITLNLADAISLNDLAKANKVNLMVGHLLLFHSAFIKTKELIDKGLLGKIQYIYSNRLNLGSFRSDENVLWSFAPHDIALFNYFFDDAPDEIITNGLDILQKGIHDTTITSFKYGKSRMGHIFVSWLHPFKEHRFVIIGSKGMIHFEDANKSKPLIFYDKMIDYDGSIPKSSSGNNRQIDYAANEPLKAELEYFISSNKNGKLNIADGDSAVEVMRILERATNSLIKGH